MARQCNTKFQAHNVEPGVEYLGKQLRATETGNRIFHSVAAKDPTSGEWMTFFGANKDEVISQAREWRAALAKQQNEKTAKAMNDSGCFKPFTVVGG